jgi:hypothetical protein
LWLYTRRAIEARKLNAKVFEKGIAGLHSSRKLVACRIQV